ncbi:GFA family protein [Sphingomonas sp. R-74633]|uniref:GFA family protein n=1 Tax=Sphingomonas sp. R-74633 TaxID=2751188 RepID=UPI0015D21DD5|nr:GFA family protein [Sphingomonas sp. R-74633]NYT39576.1 GFA family protein [Sphingomonas sp. R-74633]
MAEEMTGGCQCGRVRYAVRIADDEAYLCHCRMCQRATGGVSIAFKNVGRADVRWEREPERYASSPIAVRAFCRECGTPLTYEAHGHDRMDLTIGSFDAPDRFYPTEHSGCESWHKAWLDTSDLPASRTDENPSLVKRWMDTLGRLPD